MTDPAPQISILGIPTRDRPPLLERCISSHATNALAFGRPLQIVVSDDSRSSKNQDENLAVIQKLKKQFDLQITHLCYNSKLHQADLLSGQTGCSLKVAQFALLGHEDCTLSFGAARNALLLWAAGNPYVQVDDDTICAISQSPSYQAGQHISDADDANIYYLFDNSADLFKTINPLEIDFLTLHEQTLGHHVATETGSVVASFLGTAGDSGMYGHTFRLFEQNETSATLTSSEKSFRSKMATRTVYKVASQTSISRGPFCMAIHMGLDARYLLPPFMPAMRNEDGVFGMTLHECMPQALRSYIPYAVQHLPPEQRPPLNFEDTVRFKGLRTNDLMCQLIRFVAGSSIHTPDLVELGNQLQDISKLTDVHFHQTLLHVARQTQYRVAAYAQSCLEQQPFTPSYWIEAVQTYIDSSLHAAQQPDLIIPIDLKGTSTTRLALFQELVYLFGGLLEYWPAIMETSRQLRSNLT